MFNFPIIPPQLKLQLKQWIANKLDAVARTVWSPMSQFPTTLPSLDADVLLEIMREAECGNTTRLFSVYRDLVLSDSHIQAEWNKRVIAVIGDSLATQPFDKQNADDVAADEFIKTNVIGHETWVGMLTALMQGHLWPVAVVEKVFAPASPAPDSSEAVRPQFQISKMIPVPHDLWDYRFGYLTLRDADPESGVPTADIREPDPARYIVHRGHILQTGDNWGGPMRSLLFWWLFKTQNREFWIRFLDRYKSPFLIGRCDPNDDASRSTLVRAFSAATKLFGIVISKDTTVEVEAAASTDDGTAYEKMHNLASDEMSKLIVGHTLSARAQNTGLGSGVAGLQGEVREDLRIYDELVLGATVRSQLFAQVLQINGLRGRAPKCVWGGVTAAQAKLLASVLAELKTAALEPTDDALPVLGEKLGFAIQRVKAPALGDGETGTPGGSSKPETFNAALPFLLTLFAANVLPGAEAEEANDSVAAAAAADFARSLRRTFAPLARIVRESRSPREMESRVRAFCAELSPADPASSMLRSLEAFAANGSIVNARTLNARGRQAEKR